MVQVRWAGLNVGGGGVPPWLGLGVPWKQASLSDPVLASGWAWLGVRGDTARVADTAGAWTRPSAA